MRILNFLAFFNFYKSVTNLITETYLSVYKQTGIKIVGCSINLTPYRTPQICWGVRKIDRPNASLITLAILIEGRGDYAFGHKIKIYKPVFTRNN